MNRKAFHNTILKQTFVLCIALAQDFIPTEMCLKPLLYPLDSARLMRCVLTRAVMQCVDLG